MVKNVRCQKWKFPALMNKVNGAPKSPPAPTKLKWNGCACLLSCLGERGEENCRCRPFVRLKGLGSLTSIPTLKSFTCRRRRGLFWRLATSWQDGCIRLELLNLSLSRHSRKIQKNSEDYQFNTIQIWWSLAEIPWKQCCRWINTRYRR